jgi:hypothetical protein
MNATLTQDDGVCDYEEICLDTGSRPGKGAGQDD